MKAPEVKAPEVNS